MQTLMSGAFSVCIPLSLQLAPWNIFSGEAQNYYISGCDSSPDVGEKTTYFVWWSHAVFSSSHSATKLEGIPQTKRRFVFLSGKCWHLLQIHFFKDLSSLDFLLIITANTGKQLLCVKCVTRQCTYITLVFPTARWEQWELTTSTFYSCGLSLREIKYLGQGHLPTKCWMRIQIQLWL